jgi:hypothetical protein
MLYADLDLSRKRLDYHLLDAEGATVDVGASPPDADGLRGLTARLVEPEGPPGAHSNRWMTDFSHAGAVFRDAGRRRTSRPQHQQRPSVPAPSSGPPFDGSPR